MNLKLSFHLRNSAMLFAILILTGSCKKQVQQDVDVKHSAADKSLALNGVGTLNTDVEISGWYNDGWNTESHTVYMNNNTKFSVVNPYWYNLGTSDTAPGKSVTNGSIYERSYAYNAAQITQIHANGDLVIPTIADMAQGQINTIFANATSRANLIKKLVNKAVQRNYDGWDLNFELGNETGKALYTAFVNDLSDSLAAKGKVLDITIGAFENTLKESYWIFDLTGLKTCKARRIKIMAYDQNLGPNGQVGAVADINWVKDVLDYMVVSRGLPVGKVMLGIANYGWVYKQIAGVYTLQYPFRPYTYITTQPGFLTWWDNYYKENYAEWTTGGSNYLAYYNDVTSVSARLDLVSQYNLAGAAFWVLGREDLNIYPALALKFPGNR